MYAPAEKFSKKRLVPVVEALPPMIKSQPWLVAVGGVIPLWALMIVAILFPPPSGDEFPAI